MLNNLKEKNQKALKTNNYSIDECIQDANTWFDELVVNVTESSRGWKLCCKKLADEVLNLRQELKSTQKNNLKPALNK